MSTTLVQTITGLLTLTPVEVAAIARFAHLVPELLTVSEDDVLQLCAVLAMKAEPRITPPELVRLEPATQQRAVDPLEKPAAIHAIEPEFELDPKVLEVAQADPTQSPEVPGWDVHECQSCQRHFQHPKTGYKKPRSCWFCLCPRDQRKRLEVLSEYLASS